MKSFCICLSWRISRHFPCCGSVSNKALSQISASDNIRNEMDENSRHKSLGPARVYIELTMKLWYETEIWNCLHETISILQNCRVVSVTRCERGLWSEGLASPPGSLVKLDRPNQSSTGKAQQHFGKEKPGLTNLLDGGLRRRLLRLARVYNGNKIPCQWLFKKPSRGWEKKFVWLEIAWKV